MIIKKVHVFALAAHGRGLSGSDRIFIEISRILSKEKEVEIYVQEEGLKMCQRQNLSGKNIKFKVIKINPLIKRIFLFSYIYLILKSILMSFFLSLEDLDGNILYSASEFWMDSLPTLILKKRFRNLKWIAAWFQTAPNPLKGFNEGTRRERYWLNSFLYWFVQIPVKPLIHRNADLILVNNNDEVKQFKNLKKNQKIMVFLGAINLDFINSFKKQYKGIPKRFLAVFQGRFHPQKGVVELVEIWRKVVERKPGAMLAMIGDGPLIQDVKEKISKLNLEKNIELFGYLFDGQEKFKIFAESRIVVHPSFFDSGGMAAAEAMAFGIPAVGFDLVAYQSYYPRGMIKVSRGDIDEFAGEIIHLSEDRKKYKRLALEAENMVKNSWSFEDRVQQILKNLNDS